MHAYWYRAGSEWILSTVRDGTVSIERAGHGVWVADIVVVPYYCRFKLKYYFLHVAG